MKEQFTGGVLGKLKRLEVEGQTVLNFDGSENKGPRDFSAYNSEQKMALVASIRGKQVNNIPLSDEESEFLKWNDKFEDGKRER